MLCKASIGHTAAVNNQVLAVIMDFFHLLGMSLWLGNLLALVLLLPGESKKEKTTQSIGKPYSVFQRLPLFLSLYC